MFNSIPLATEDKIFGLVELYNKDKRKDKINLLSGVYQDEDGEVAILSVVKKVEEEILKLEKTKNYLEIEGDFLYRKNILNLLTNNNSDNLHCDAIQTPGGTAALYLISSLLSEYFPNSKIWISDPTWPNHLNIFKYKAEVKQYVYYNRSINMLCFDHLLDSIDKANSGDFILLHACCHNPTGADLDNLQWQQLLDKIKSKKMSVIFDLAYQGFAKDLESDVFPIQLFIRNLDVVIVASSNAKNFGLYNERVGALSIFCQDLIILKNIISQLKSIARRTYSNPPAHGIKIINTILGNDEYKSLWISELMEMKNRILKNRIFFSDYLTQNTEINFDFVKKQKGLFSFINLATEQAIQLRELNGIYLLESGRINIAGLNESNMNIVCDAIKKLVMEKNCDVRN